MILLASVIVVTPRPGPYSVFLFDKDFPFQQFSPSSPKVGFLRL